MGFRDKTGWLIQQLNNALAGPIPSICLPHPCISITLGAGHEAPSRHSSFLLACESQDSPQNPLSAHPIDWSGSQAHV